MMNVVRLIKLNLRIIRVINSCDRTQFMELLDDVVDIPGIFRKKRYIWNVIRPRDMYKMVAHWVVGRCEKYQNDINNPIELARTLGLDFDGDVVYPTQIALVYLNPIESTIHEILNSTGSYNIKRTFVYGIVKSQPILTIDTIQYLSEEKIKHMLNGDKTLICDDTLRPFIDVIMDQREQNRMYQSLMEDTTDV